MPWKWFENLNENYEKEKHASTKFVLAGFIIFMIIPTFLYYFIKADPGYDEHYGRGGLGVLVVLAIYNIGAYFSYKAYLTKKRLNKLIDKLMDEKERSRVLEIAEEQEKHIKDKKTSSCKEGEERIKWFNIK